MVDKNYDPLLKGHILIPEAFEYVVDVIKLISLQRTDFSGLN